jgi:hypothetical protein
MIPHESQLYMVTLTGHTCNICVLVQLQSLTPHSLSRIGVDREVQVEN